MLHFTICIGAKLERLEIRSAGRMKIRSNQTRFREIHGFGVEIPENPGFWAHPVILGLLWNGVSAKLSTDLLTPENYSSPSLGIFATCQTEYGFAYVFKKSKKGVIFGYYSLLHARVGYIVNIDFGPIFGEIGSFWTIFGWFGPFWARQIKFLPNGHSSQDYSTWP